MNMSSEISNSTENRRRMLTFVSRDLLSISPLIFRSIRRRLIKTSTFYPDLNITPLHYEILRLLESEKTLHVSEIGERLQVAKAQMTKVIDKLVNLNMVERKADPSDRRILNITLTERGHKFMNDSHNQIIEAVQEILTSLTDEDLEILLQSLHNMRHIFLKA
jgi:DNA-binding MarR family transcriptional regulator